MQWPVLFILGHSSVHSKMNGKIRCGFVGRILALRNSLSITKYSMKYFLFRLNLADFCFPVLVLSCLVFKRYLEWRGWKQQGGGGLARFLVPSMGSSTPPPPPPPTNCFLFESVPNRPQNCCLHILLFISAIFPVCHCEQAVINKELGFCELKTHWSVVSLHV